MKTSDRRKDKTHLKMTFHFAGELPFREFRAQIRTMTEKRKTRTRTSTNSDAESRCFRRRQCTTGSNIKYHATQSEYTFEVKCLNLAPTTETRLPKAFRSPFSARPNPPWRERLCKQSPAVIRSKSRAARFHSSTTSDSRQLERSNLARTKSFGSNTSCNSPESSGPTNRFDNPTSLRTTTASSSSPYTAPYPPLARSF